MHFVSSIYKYFFLFLLLANYRVIAQTYSPTTTRCTTGSAAPYNPTGPETVNGGEATLSSNAPNNVEEICTWSDLASSGTVSAQPMTLSFYYDTGGTGADPIANIHVAAGDASVTIKIGSSGEFMMTVPAGTDLSTVVVSATVKAANTVTCTSSSPERICYGAEAVIDIGYISLS